MSEDQTTNETDVPLEDFDQDTPAPISHGARAHATAEDLTPVYDVPVQVSAVLGKTNVQVSDLLSMEAGAIIELDRKVGEAIDIYVNHRLIARGEVVKVNDHLGVTMTEIIETETE